MGLKRVLLRVEGRGCGSCITPVKTHLFKHPAVKSVHVIGYNVIVEYDDDYTIEDILHETRVLEYYRVREIKEISTRSGDQEVTPSISRYIVKTKGNV